MLKYLRFALGAVILSIVTAGNASATTITLDNLASDFRYKNPPVYNENGFTISVNCTNCVNVFSTEEPMSGYDASTEAAGWGADQRFLETWNQSAIFTLSHASGSAFDFTGLNIGWFDNATTDASWNIRAYNESGDQIGTQINLTGIGFFAVAFEDVHAIEFQNNSLYSSFDNLQVQAVPEPNMLFLLATILLMPGWIVRRKR